MRFGGQATGSHQAAQQASAQQAADAAGTGGAGSQHQAPESNALHLGTAQLVAAPAPGHTHAGAPPAAPSAPRRVPHPAQHDPPCRAHQPNSQHHSTHMAGRRRTASDIAIVSESEANSYDSDSDSDSSDSDVDSTVNDSGGSELYESDGDTLSTSSGGGVGGQDSPHEPVRAQTHDSHVRAH